MPYMTINFPEETFQDRAGDKNVLFNVQFLKALKNKNIYPKVKTKNTPLGNCDQGNESIKI